MTIRLKFELGNLNFLKVRRIYAIKKTARFQLLCISRAFLYMHWKAKNSFYYLGWNSIYLERSERRVRASKKWWIFSIIFVKKSNFSLKPSDLTGLIRFLISFSNLSSLKNLKKRVAWHPFRPSGYCHFNREFWLSLQRSQPIFPDMSFNILSYSNAPLHYLAYLYFR